MLSDHRKFARAGSRKKIILATLDTWNERNATTLYARRNHYVLINGECYEVVRVVDKYWSAQNRFHEVRR